MILSIRIVAIFICLFLSDLGYAADILFIGSNTNPNLPQQKLEFACQFYGLDIESIILGEGKDEFKIENALKRRDIKGIVITANALPVIQKQRRRDIPYREAKARIPILVIDVNPSITPDTLKNWSRGAILNCIIPETANDRLLKIAELDYIAKQLKGVSIPLKRGNPPGLIVDNTVDHQSIIEVRNLEGNQALPVFVKVLIGGREVFFQTEIETSESLPGTRWEYGKDKFFEIVSLIMFLRYSCGERCWHATGHYANLTIDDPWLIEPYGLLSFKDLLKEMKTVNFHTTIAFIPWNYDRSRPEVIPIFRDNPDRFSIAIHGNNHDHREFYKYEVKTSDLWEGKTLDEQEKNLVQALARMEAFKHSTGISYDRVMIFPHGIGPAKTLGLLKKYKFLATVNSENIPLGSNKLDTTPVYARSALMEYENFPSLKRYNPSFYSDSDIAIDLFLDNPILFYAHHDMFSNRMDAFNKTAKMVNEIEADIKWGGLGNIIRHLYLEKVREDGNYDVMAFGNDLVIENNQQHDAIFHIKKKESFAPDIKQVTVDANPYSYERSRSHVIINIMIPKAGSRHVLIEYENDSNLGSIDLSKNNLRVRLLRYLSDFRDIIVYKILLGRILIKYYYDSGLYKLGVKGLGFILVILMIVIYGCFHLRKHAKGNRY